MKRKSIEELLRDVAEIKQRRSQMKKPPFSMVENDVAYNALITDGIYHLETDIVSITMRVYNTSQGTEDTIQFNLKTFSKKFYADLCSTLGTNGDPSELIGKAVIMHYEQNGNFQNAKVDMEISRKELVKNVREMEREENAYSFSEDDQLDESEDIDVDDEESEVVPRKPKSSSKKSKKKKRLVRHSEADVVDMELDDDLDDF